MTAKDNALGKSHSEIESSKFLTGTATLAAAAQSFALEKKKIALAVAFWGRGSIEALKVSEWKAVERRIICNATSGACNPSVMRELKKLLGSNFKTNPNLHAKIYLTSSEAIISSANASASGLSFEGSEVAGNIEAGIKTNCKELIETCSNWFEEIWTSNDTIVIDDEIIDRAENIWRQRRADRGYAGNDDKILRNKDFIKERNIFVINYDAEDRSKEAEKRTEKLENDFKNEVIRSPMIWGADIKFNYVDSYEEESENIKNYEWDSWVIDLAEKKCCFWRIPPKSQIEKLKNKCIFVPIFGAKEIEISGTKIKISSDDIEFLKDKWNNKYNQKTQEWVAIDELL